MVTVTFELEPVLKSVAGLAVAGFFFVLVRKLVRAVRRLFAPRLEGMDRRAVGARWAEIERLVATGKGMEMRMAVLEADKLLDHALKAMSMSGNTLGERLKFAAYRYPKIRNVWWAHRLRNSLAHEPTFRLEKHTAKRAVKEFEKTLRMLNVM